VRVKIHEIALCFKESKEHMIKNAYSHFFDLLRLLEC